MTAYIQQIKQAVSSAVTSGAETMKTTWKNHKVELLVGAALLVGGAIIVGLANNNIGAFSGNPVGITCAVCVGSLAVLAGTLAVGYSVGSTIWPNRAEVLSRPAPETQPNQLRPNAQPNPEPQPEPSAAVEAQQQAEAAARAQEQQQEAARVQAQQQAEAAARAQEEQQAQQQEAARVQAQQQAQPQAEQQTQQQAAAEAAARAQAEQQAQAAEAARLLAQQQEAAARAQEAAAAQPGNSLFELVDVSCFVSPPREERIAAARAQLEAEINRNVIKKFYATKDSGSREPKLNEAVDAYLAKNKPQIQKPVVPNTGAQDAPKLPPSKTSNWSLRSALKAAAIGTGVLVGLYALAKGAQYAVNTISIPHVYGKPNFNLNSPSECPASDAPIPNTDVGSWRPSGTPPADGSGMFFSMPQAFFNRSA